MSVDNNATGADTNLENYTVVVVDDEPNILEALKRCVRHEPFQIVCAGSGAEGLKLIAGIAHVAVIISDQMMPEMNGSEFLARSRKICPDAIRVLLTGHSDMDTTITAMNEGGATHYIVKQKPWNDADLRQTVQRCVRDYHQIMSTRYLQEVISQKNNELQELLRQLTEKNDRLNEAKEYAENIVETMREPLLVLNSDLRILSANGSFYRTFKVTSDETIGSLIYDLGNRQWDIPKLRLLLDEILLTNTVFNNYEVEHDFQNIGHKSILLNARQIFRKDIGSHLILLALEDITNRRLERAIEQSPITIVLTNTQGIIEFVNPRFTELTGYSAEEAIGQNPRIMQSGKTPPETYKELWATLTAGNLWEGEFANKRKDGTLFYEHATISSLRDDNGTITHYLAVKQDVTEKKNTLEQLIHSQKMQSIGQLAGGLAHDLNNILSLVSG